jgi:hypothetical protein
VRIAAIAVPENPSVIAITSAANSRVVLLMLPPFWPLDDILRYLGSTLGLLPANFPESTC